MFLTLYLFAPLGVCHLPGQRSSQAHEQPRYCDETSRHRSTTTLHCRGIHDEPLSHGQPTQPQGFATRWADGEEPTCTRDLPQQHIASQTATTSSSHLCVDGDTLTSSSAPLTFISNGSLQNKIFRDLQVPPKSLRHLALQELCPVDSITTHCSSLGKACGLFTIDTFTNTSPTRTSPASNNSSRALCSTTRTNVLRPYGSAPVVSWSWKGTTQCICPTKTEKT